MSSRNSQNHANNTSLGDSAFARSQVVEALSRSRLAPLTAVTAALLLSACGGVSDGVPAGEFERAVVEWQLVFEDEFEDTSLDASKWNIQTGDGTDEGIPGWGNNELQIYSEDNILVSGGTLTITAREELDGSYTSARINTRDKFDFTYGRVVIGARLPSGQGMWPAAWMLSTENLYGPWPPSGEIDIMESFNPGNGNTKISSTLHYGMPEPNGSFNGSEFDLEVSPDLAFHEYEVEWEKGKIRFFVDGQHFQTQNSDNWYSYFKAGPDGFFTPDGVFKLGLEAAPFDQQFHLLLNLAVGGDPVGAPDATTVFPQHYEIDYVQIYQCANANPTTGRGCGRADPSVVPLEEDDPLKIAGFDIFKDGPEVVEISLGQEQASNTLQVGEFNDNGSVIANDPLFTDPDDATNIVWHVNIAGSGGVGNVFIGSEILDEESLLETGFDLRRGDIAGQLQFEMLVNSISGATILIRMDSGFPDGGEVALADPVVGEWQTYGIDIADLLANPAFVDQGGQGIDLENVLNLFVFEVLDGDVDVYLDNISVSAACKTSSGCNAQPKGSPEDVIVFDDAVGELWIGGIEAFDTDSGGDYRDPQSANKINWEIKPAEDTARGNIIEVVFEDNSASGVWFISSNPQLGVAGATDLSGFAEGALIFDIRVTDYDTASGITMKVDCDFSDNQCGSGDQFLGRIADGVWETITIPVSQLVRGGLNLTKINTGIVIFPGFAPVGITFQVDNIRWTLTADVPDPVLDPIDLPVTFDDPFVDYTVIDFGDPVAASTVLGADPDGASNTVAITTKPTGAPVWAGTTIGNPVFANPIPFTANQTSMSVDVRVPMAGIPVRLKVETADCPSDGSDPTCFAELDAFPLMADQWETLSWDFSTVDIDTAMTFEKASIFFDFGTEGNDAVYFWDNVVFGAPPPAPTIALSNDGFETGDLSGWTSNGDNTAGAPSVGAQSGDFAAQLTVTGGGGVPELNQSFAASPGDEVNFSAWMLTEAALPAGPSFGLAKIVFKDAAGNDLVPESASIGTLITGDFPGIESIPPLNDASPVNTWVFTEAQGVAPAGTTEVVFLLLNIDFAGGENPIWFDTAAATLVTGPPGELVNAGFEAGDLSGWTSNGDNTAGAPGVGAQAGDFAALLTVTGGGGVPELNQSFAASPGDEFNFSAWMLTEAELPVGASFGLAKIVFKDAAGNDLVPESASIGMLISGDFPGIESAPPLNNLSPIDTWVFTEAQGVAPAGTTEVVFLLLNIDFAGGENPIWFDTAAATLVTGGGGGTPCAPCTIDFETPGVGGDFDWSVFENADNPPLEIVANPDPTGNTSATVAKFTARVDGAFFAGAQTFHPADGPGVADIGPFDFDASNSIVKVWVWKPVISEVRMQFVNTTNGAQDPLSVTNTLVNQWEELTFDFTGFIGSTGFVDTDRLVIFPDWDEAGRTSENIIYFDSITFSGSSEPPPPSDELVNAGFEAGDLSGWTSNGDNTAGAPGVGAQAGDFAALLTVTGGGGVPELSQTLAANPGDEFNFS
ncbi:MAG: family 16 glycosylhydrolase, partial [Gammaproteobacteria bacterium]|nr:family 16 glycosylhydrolase [Gammaproteobacteria bacterium]